MNREEIKRFFGWSERDFDIVMINGLPFEKTSNGVVFDPEEIVEWLSVNEMKEDDLIWLLMRRLTLAAYSIEDSEDKEKILLPTIMRLDKELKKLGVIKK